MKEYTAYSDGSADNLNPSRPGGAAYIIFNEDGSEFKRKSKGFLNTSNNRMEILAIISIVNSLPHGASVTIHSDSQYSINVLSSRWQASSNLDQIALYRKLVSEKNIKVQFIWVKGHNGNQYNELCDQMARAEYSKMLEQHNTKRSKQSLPSETYSCITTKGRRKPVKRRKK